MPARNTKRGTPAATRAVTAERRAKAVRLRAAGADWQTIADQLGYSNKGSACTDVNRALQASLAECRQETEVLREQELQRLDVLWMEAWKVLRRRHDVVSNGRLMKGADGQTLQDDGPTLAAIDRLLKIQERRAKYLGLDAATKVELLTVDVIDDQIRTLTAQLAELDRTEATEAAGTEGTAG